MVHLRQNLISNAIKFHSDVLPEVRVSCKENWREFIFSVKDNRTDPESNQEIFEIFQRLHTREQNDGTGIGWTIAKRIFEGPGGRIWVESEGKGSTFYFSTSKSVWGNSD